MSIAVYIIFPILVVVFYLWYRRQIIKETDFLKNVQEPSSALPFFGVALDFSSTKVMLEKLINYTETYGSVVKAKIGPLRQILLISDYRLLEQILSSTKLLRKSDDYYFFGTWLGTGLLTSDGQKWKKHRRILTPAFHFQILEQFINVFNSCGDTLVVKLGSHIGKESVDIYPLVTLCTLDVICGELSIIKFRTFYHVFLESIMGIKINAQNDDTSDYVRSVKNMCRIVMERSVSPVEMYDLFYPLSKNFYTERKALKVLHKQSNDVIYARKKQLEQKIETNEKKKAFLDLLLQTEIDSRPLTHEEIRQEVDTFMFEGHDTTASALSFTLYCLANHAEAQAQAYEEQQYIFQNRYEAAATYSDLQSMKYLECVIKESLRLYPSVPFYGRQVTEDVQFDDKVLPKGVTLVIFAYGIQRNSTYFKNPLEFKPERFENNDGKLPYAFIPFSAGPRNCIGQKFAMLEMKCVLSKILRTFELMPAKPEHKLHLISETILKSANGVNISLQPRKT